MKNTFISYLILAFYLLSPVVFAQRYDTINIADSNNNKRETTRITNFPQSKIPLGTSEAYITVYDTADAYAAFLSFKINNKKLLKLPTITFSREEPAYICTDPEVSFRNDTITVECNLMKGIMAGQKFILIKNQLRFIHHFQEDLNDDTYQKAELALKRNDPVAFCEAYMGAQFYNDYPYRVKEAIALAHKIALNDYKKGKYVQAAELMQSIELNCMLATDLNVAKLFPDDFKKIWGDASLFYLKANQNEACIRLSKWLTDYYTDYIAVYLQYGDALYNTNRLEESKSVYQKYVELMDKKGLISKVPQRVNDRVK